MSADLPHSPPQRDPVIIAVSAVGLAALALGWLVVKPTRLSEGTALAVWNALRPGELTALGVLWLVCLGAGILGPRRRGALAAGLAANALLALALLFGALGAARQLSAGPEHARVAIGGGLWLTLGCAYLVIFTARRRLGGDRRARWAVSCPGALAVLVFLLLGRFNGFAVAQEFLGREDQVLRQLVRHLYLVGVAVGVGTVVGVPLGVWAGRNGRARRYIFFGTNVTQTIPSLALFGLLIAPLSAVSQAVPALRGAGIRGIGVAPALIALALYSLLPIVRNTYTGLRGVDPAVVDAGLGMGMTPRQAFLRLEAPLAAPLVLEGVRTAAVQAVGNAAVAALIGAGGLGEFIFQGLDQQAPGLVLVGALPVVALALAVDALMRVLKALASPRMT